MNGILKYDPKNVPKVGDKVVLVVNGENFPSGVWFGTLEQFKSEKEPNIMANGLAADYCVAKTSNNNSGFCLDAEWVNKEPERSYDVYPYTPGMNVLMAQLYAQKREVKALKQRLEEKEQKARDVLKGLFDLAGVRESSINQGLADFDSIYTKRK